MANVLEEQNVAPENVAPENVATENVAPENVAPRKKLKPGEIRLDDLLAKRGLTMADVEIVGDKVVFKSKPKPKRKKLKPGEIRLDDYLFKHGLTMANVDRTGDKLRIRSKPRPKFDLESSLVSPFEAETARVGASFVNEALFNAPKSLMNITGKLFPEPQTSLGKVAGGVAGLAGAVLGPGKLLGAVPAVGSVFSKAGKLTTPLIKSIGAGATYGLARFPTEDPFDIVKRAKQGLVGGAASGVFFGFGKFLRGLFSSKDKIQIAINNQLKTRKTLDDMLVKIADLPDNVNSFSSRDHKLVEKATLLTRRYNKQGKVLEKQFSKTPIAQNITRAIGGATPEELLSDRITPDQAQQLIRKLSNVSDDSIVNIVDIGSKSVRSLARSAATVPGASKDKITRFLEDRSVKSATRIKNALNEYLSEKEFFSTVDDVIAERKALSAPFYEKAAEKSVSPEKLAPWFKDDRFKRAEKKARQLFGIDSKKASNSIEVLHAIQQVWNDTVGANFRVGKFQAARQFKLLRNNLLKVIDDEVPDYAQARSIFAGESSLKTAMEDGIKFNTKAPEQLKKIFKNLSEGEKSSFRIGVQENIRKIVDTTSDDADSARKIFGKPEMRNQLKVIFDRDKFGDFSRNMHNEIRAAKSKFEILGGSTTDFNISEIGQTADTIGRVASRPKLTTVINELTGKAIETGKRRFQGLTPESAENLTDTLLDRKKTLEVLKKLANKKV